MELAGDGADMMGLPEFLSDRTPLRAFFPWSPGPEEAEESR